LADNHHIHILTYKGKTIPTTTITNTATITALEVKIIWFGNAAIALVVVVVVVVVVAVHICCCMLFMKEYCSYYDYVKYVNMHHHPDHQIDC